MKRYIYLILIIFLILTINACSKSKNYSYWDNVKLMMGFQPATPYLNDDFSGANYCKGCGTSSNNTFHCQGRDCIPNDDCSETEALSYVSDITTQQLNDKNAMYVLRDSFLINSTMGQWYITYYYELSRIAIENNMINASTYLDYLQFGVDLLAAINKIRNGDPTNIPVDEDMKSKAEMFLADFRFHTTDTLIIQYLDNIQGDLDYFTGKDAAHILSIIEN